MRNKVKVHDMSAFAAEYPQLVKIVPDNRKIMQALKLGFNLPGVEIVEDDDDALPEPDVTVAGENQVAAASTLDKEGEAIKAHLQGTLPPGQEDVTKGFTKEPGESVRSFHERCRKARQEIEKAKKAQGGA